MLLFSTIISLYLVTSNGLIWALNATKGSSEEALSVPMQQLAHVYYEYGEKAFTNEELSLIYEGISVSDLQNYNPFLSDNIKNHFNFNVVMDNKWDYVKLWLTKLSQYPSDYIKAFLDNTYQAWYPSTSVYDAPNATDTYYFGIDMCPGGERNTKAPALLEFYTKIATDYYYQKLPVVRLLFSIGAMFWIALFTFTFAIYRRNKPLIAAMLMLLLYCATTLMGPVSLVRYYLVLFYGFPVSMGYLLKGSR